MTGRVGDMEVDEDLGTQQREWRIERVTFVVIGALLAAALLGVFGTGPLAWTKVASDAGTLSVEYERFARRGGTSAFTVTIAPSAQRDGKFQLLIDADYLDAFMIEAVTPEPAEVAVGKERVRYTFLPADPDASLSVTFHVRPQRLWNVPASVGLPGDVAVDYWHFFYP